ncbi:DUF2231 domain-containing protein [Arthrobacter sp. OV608]|uniref:DUF2231 domain-containing protein n=1 Tax=Arthrobacter sp. OV608 TaxID=1882768 RepID=UPI002570C37A|nr:DUF2231 domain-containing protein [Arthrobacter sp. OV608]
MMENLTAHQRSKHPKSPLAGPYGHPLHPTLVTIPIGAWTASLVFDVVALFGSDDKPFLIGAQWLVGIGILGALAAAVFGLMDFATLAGGTPAHRTALIHMSLNLTAVALFAVSFFLRLGSAKEDFALVPFILSVVGYLVVGASGYLGGKLAYHYGVRVADEKTQGEGFV